MSDGIVAALITGGITLLGSVGTILYTSGQTKGVIQTGMQAVAQRMDGFDDEQKQQWDVIGKLRDGQGKHGERIGFLEGKLNGKHS